jgi:uncharacterized repeat protein (TIGR03803 family)
MKKVQEPTSRIHGQLLIGLVAAIVVMSVVVLSGQELKHVPPAAPSFIVLHTFAGFPTDGDTPSAGLLRDAAGNLYGTTVNGGAHGSGVVFKLSPSGNETVLYSFTGGADGGYPSAGLLRDAAGNLYGTTVLGGPGGSGVVFKLSPTGTETVLYSFTGGNGGTDGGFPTAGLLRDAAGNLYGTTFYGGSGNCLDPFVLIGGCGVVFKLSAMGTETVLYSFAGPPDGQYPVAGLIPDAAGNLYGTTEFGGVYNGYCEKPNPHNAYTCGVVFKLSPSGTETVLHTFAGYPTDGGNPYAGLLRDAAGNLYGTTLNGGADGSGVVFKLSPTGTETLLHTFTGPDGARPSAGLIKDTLGNLYGTTIGGGAHGQGVVFELIRCSSAPSGYEFKVLHSFTGGDDGAYPWSGLVRDGAGNLYGTTSRGGASGNGVVFRLTP